MPDSSSLPKPAFPAPRGRPAEWNMDELKKHCQTAVLLELHTIPMYLYSMYCVDGNKDETEASDKILGIVVQEMLHLCLAGNLMRACKLEPVLWGEEHTPKYPCEIFYDPLELHLAPPHKDTIETFVKVEEPFERITLPRGNIMPGYGSIGEFYDSFGSGLKILNDKMPDLFDPSSKGNQFVPEDRIYRDEGLHAITNLSEALAALTLIVEQGEGSTGTDNLDTPSHFEIFKALSEQDVAYIPTVEDPVTSQFEGNIQTVMLASDAAYCYLLLSIEKCWTSSNHRQDLVGNIMPLMRFIIKYCAEFLVTQKIDGGDKYAAPPFNYYPFSSVASAHSELVKALQTASENYPTNKKLDIALNKAKTLFDLSQLSS